MPENQSIEGPQGLMFFDTVEEIPQELDPLDLDSGEPAFTDNSVSKLVAVITAALLAGGLIGQSSVVTAIRPVPAGNPWRMAGLIDLMNSRDLLLFR